jgi:GNAT superfamily N-acetyltransferase
MNINSLSDKNIEAAIDLATSIFTRDNDPAYIRKCLESSLDGTYGKLKPFGTPVTMLEYWTAIEDEQVVGLTGIYTTEEDEKESSWLGWFCVDENHRRKGIGKALLNTVIDLAKQLGKKSFRLYTSTHADEDAAKEMYAKLGFQEIGKEPCNDGTEDSYIIMELMFNKEGKENA